MLKQEIKIGESITEIELYQRLSTVFLTVPMPLSLLLRYYYEGESDTSMEMVEFISAHLRPELSFSVSAPIMDAIDAIIGQNVDNGNIVKKEISNIFIFNKREFSEKMVDEVSEEMATFLYGKNCIGHVSMDAPESFTILSTNKYFIKIF